MTEAHEENIDLQFGMAVMKGAAVGFPIMVVGIIAAVFLFTDQSFNDSVMTGLLAGTLMGVFGGGFIGVLKGMGH